MHHKLQDSCCLRCNTVFSGRWFRISKSNLMLPFAVLKMWRV